MISISLVMWLCGQAIVVVGILIAAFRYQQSDYKKMGESIQADYKRITSEIWSENKDIRKDLDNYKLIATEKCAEVERRISERIEDKLEKKS